MGLKSKNDLARPIALKNDTNPCAQICVGKLTGQWITIWGVPFPAVARSVSTISTRSAVTAGPIHAVQDFHHHRRHSAVAGNRIGDHPLQTIGHSGLIRWTVSLGTILPCRGMRALRHKLVDYTIRAVDSRSTKARSV